MATDLARALVEVMSEREFVSAMERFARGFPEYRSSLPSLPYAYSRTRLAVAPAFEVVAMNWAPHSTSPIHDHGASRCWVLMLGGTLDVQNFVCDEGASASDSVPVRATEHFVLRPGDVDHRLGPTEFHRVHNPSPSESAYSLQLYARPLTTYCVVDARTLRRRIVTATCELDLSFA